MAVRKKTIPRPGPALRGLPGRLHDCAKDQGYLTHGQQKVLAQKAGIDPGHLSRLLNVNNPTAKSKKTRENDLSGIRAETVIRLADALDVNPGWLLANQLPKRAARRATPLGLINVEGMPPIGEADEFGVGPNDLLDKLVSIAEQLRSSPLLHLVRGSADANTGGGPPGESGPKTRK
jgi:hypothetical protein